MWLKNPLTALVKVILGFLLCIPRIVPDIYLFKEGTYWEWVVGWYIRPMETAVIWITLAHPPIYFHHPPNQLQVSTTWMPMPVIYLASLGSQRFFSA